MGAHTQKTVLENGIRVVTQSVPGMRSLAMSVVIDGGLHSEPEGKNGLAHIVEHMMFQGTSTRDANAIAELMDMAGGNVGGFTARDYTCYYATVLDENRTYAMELLGDVLQNSIFPEERLVTEKRAIASEIQMDDDVFEHRTNGLLKSTAWRGHTLGKPVAGHIDVVNRMTREDVIYYVHQSYTPDRMIIAAAGNVEHADFCALVRDAFWRMLGEARPPKRIPVVHRGGVVTQRAPSQQVYFALGIPAVPYAHPGRYDMHVLTSLFGSGSSSRLYRSIREERGLVYAIGASYEAYWEGGMLVVEGSTSPENVVPVIELTIGELIRLASGEPFGAVEVRKTVTQLRARHLLDSESTSTLMSRLATQELYFGRFVTQEEIVREIERVTPETLSRFAAEHLPRAVIKPTLVTIGPESPHYSRERLLDFLSAFSE